MSLHSMNARSTSLALPRPPWHGRGRPADGVQHRMSKDSLAATAYTLDAQTPLSSRGRPPVTTGSTTVKHTTDLRSGLRLDAHRLCFGTDRSLDSNGDSNRSEKERHDLDRPVPPKAQAARRRKPSGRPPGPTDHNVGPRETWL